MLRMLLLLCLFLDVGLTPAQSVSVPKSVSAAVGRIVTVPVVSDGAQTRWFLSSETVDCFREYDPDPHKLILRLVCSQEGTFTLTCITCKGDKLSDPAVCVITCGTSPTPPGPGPGPDPGPDPFGSGAPGLKVLVVLDAATVGTLPPKQLQALKSTETLAYMNAHCGTDADGKTKTWRIWDTSIDPSNEAKMWQTAFARPRKSLPWVILSNGRTHYEGPLPNDFTALMGLLKKYGE